ncbi:MAG: multidrug efflux system membrane fusion protein [Verrucomicrobiales bacterium]|jgi:multidrug efflux system membrane fusion protein
MTHFGKIVAAVLILIAGVAGAMMIFEFKPVAEKTDPPRITPSVEAITVQRETIAVTVPSQGVLEPFTETQVAAEVAGKVMKVSPKFEVGESFAMDEILLEIDSADYIAGVAQAEATLAEAQLAMATEQARANQAEREWKKLGGDDAPTDLVLRIPQLKSVEARIKASEASLEKARRDLDRTVIRAPYDCKVRAKQTDIGSYLAPGAPIAELYRADALEVRLPVSVEDFSFIAPGDKPGVELKATVAGKSLTWSAVLTRTEGVVDRQSRSVILVGQIDPTEGDAESNRFLAPGMFMKASVAGVPLDNMFRVPREAIYGTNRVLVIDDTDIVSYREVNVVRTEQDYVIISEGLKEGEKISVTVLETVIEGKTKVDIERLNGVEQAPGRVKSQSESEAAAAVSS